VTAFNVWLKSIQDGYKWFNVNERESQFLFKIWCSQPLGYLIEIYEGIVCNKHNGAKENCTHIVILVNKIGSTRNNTVRVYQINGKICRENRSLVANI
jgi:hypothetical protein